MVSENKRSDGAGTKAQPVIYTASAYRKPPPNPQRARIAITAIKKLLGVSSNSRRALLPNLMLQKP